MMPQERPQGGAPSAGWTDGTTAFTEAEENAKKKRIKRVQARLAHLGDIPKDAYKIPEAELIPIQDNVVLEVELRLLDNV